jgi:hypothetical protein
MTVQLCLDLMLSCVTESASQSPLVLTVVLHKLANSSNSSCSNNSSCNNSSSSSSTVDPSVRLALLQALPALAGDRSCVSLLLRLGGILICV